MNKSTYAIIIAGIVIVSVFLYVFIQSDKIEVYETTLYNMTYVVEVNNFGPAVATDIPLKIALIRDWEPYQEVEMIDIYPEPESIITDAFGNQYALFTVPFLNPDSSFNVTVNAIFYSKSADFNILKSEIGRFGGAEEKFTLPSKFIESNSPLVIERAGNLSASSDFVVDYAWNAYSYIVEEIEFEQQPGELGALWTLENREGGSAELGNLFVALMRANKIPAKRISGWGNHFVIGEVLRSPQFAHGWAEFYLPEYGWVPVDPTWGKSHKFDNFAKTDDDHIILTKGAGVHFFTRGSYNSPYGEARVDTDYIVQVNDKQVSNVSPKRSLIVLIIFLFPVLFAILIYYKIRNYRLD